MSLREQAAADLRAILEDSAAGFGWPITVTDPNTKSADLVGFSNDISQSVDAGTGTLVTGRTAHVTLALAALAEAGLDIPRNVADQNDRPWIVRFQDVAGAFYVFKVSEGLVDRSIGCVLCSLEAYRP